MTAKEYLSQIRILDTYIDQKIYELMTLSSKIQGSGINTEKDCVQNSSISDTTGNLAVKLADIDLEIDRFADARHKAINQIHGLRNELFAKILFKKYVEYKRLELIAVELNYTYGYIRNAHGWALQAFERMYDIKNM